MLAIQTAPSRRQGALRPSTRTKRAQLGPTEFELSCARRMKAGDEAAAHDLVLSVWPMIVWWIKRRSRRLVSFSFEDQVQEAYIKLLQCTRSYDPDAHWVKYSTYVCTALAWITRELREKDCPFSCVPQGVYLGRADYPVESLLQPDRSPRWIDGHRRFLGLCRHLPKRERAILRRRYRGQTLRQIGQKFGISHERVRQIEERAIERMREWSQRR